jgi:iron complex transport system substrate-binding protein
MVLFVVVGLAAVMAYLVRHGARLEGPTTRVESDGDWPRTLVERTPDGDVIRRQVLGAPPQRIVSLSLATDEILIDLVDRRRIAALSSYAPKPGSLIRDRVREIPHFVEADVESIIALEPDLCFLASYNRAETRSILVDSGVPLFVFHRFDSLDDIRANIRAVGQAVGVEKKAEQLISEMNRKIRRVSEKLPPFGERPTALAYTTSGWVAGKGTFQAELFEAAGLRSAAAEFGIDGFAKVSAERVLMMDPDYLVIATGPSDTEHQKEQLSANPALASLRAIRQNRYLAIEEPLLSTVSHRAADSVVALARQAYPDRFTGEDE